jgi:hypothetical protein
MQLQPAVVQLLELGRLPRSENATPSCLNKFTENMAAIQLPVNSDEARALCMLFGDDDCFGLAWTLLHIIETASDWPRPKDLEGLHGEWIDRLAARSR